MRDVIHLPRPFPVPRQMLVIEYRHGLAAVTKDSYDLFEELPARVLGLSCLVSGIGSLLAHEYNTIHSELTSAKGESFGDGGVDLHRPVALFPLSAEVAVGYL